MRFQLSILSKKTVIKNFSLNFEQSNFPTNTIAGQIDGVYRELYNSIEGPGTSIIFHNEDGLRKEFKNKVEFFSIDNVLEYFRSLIYLAMYRIDPVVAIPALQMALMSNEIKAGDRKITPLPYPNPSPFFEYQVAPFGLDICVSEKKKWSHTNNDFPRYRKRCVQLSTHPNELPGNKKSRIMTTFDDFINRTRKMIDAGLYAKDVRRTILPLPYVNDYFLTGICKGANVADTPDRLAQVAMAATVTALMYAGMKEPDMIYDAEDQDVFWNSLITFACASDMDRQKYILEKYMEALNYISRPLKKKIELSSLIADISGDDVKALFMKDEI